MQGLRTIAAYLTLVSGAATLAHAQTPDRPVPDPLPSRSYPVGVFEPAPDLSDRSAAQRAAELDRWVEDFTEWMTWSTEWVNRREPGLFTSYRDRRQKPAPPAGAAGVVTTPVRDGDRCQRPLDAGVRTPGGLE
jgi:hypothetical protein